MFSQLNTEQCGPNVRFFLADEGDNDDDDDDGAILLISYAWQHKAKQNNYGKRRDQR